MASPMVRISERSHKTLKVLSHEEGKSMQTILDEAVKDYERKIFLEGLNADYERLRSDPKAWQEELEERALWDNTLMDGIDKNEQWNADGTALLLDEEGGCA